MSIIDEDSHENYDKDKQDVKTIINEKKSNSFSENSYFLFI